MKDLQQQAEVLAQKIRHFIITSSGRTSEEASIQEFYQAFCNTFREEIMINWTATLDSIHQSKARIANILSMEYLPGRLMGNNITNIGATELVQAVLAKLNRNLADVIACEPDPGLGNGGLGRLAACFLDSLATLRYPARGYGLRYQYGIFEQEIWNGRQVERPDCWLLNINPWEQRRDVYAVTVKFRGNPVAATNKHGEEVYLIENTEEVRALPYDTSILGYSGKREFSVLTLRLWSTKESPRNFELQRYNSGLLDQAAENTTLTDVLYPNDNNEMGKRIRLKQEFLLVSASLRDIIRRHLKSYGDFTEFADKVRIQINDTHPALVIAELVRILTKSYDFTWKEAWESCQEICSYTNHTILRESLEEWNERRVQELIPRQYNVIQRLNLEFCNTVRKRFPGDEEKVRRLSVIEHNQIRMAHLAIIGSHKVNGVAKLHGEILKRELFKDFYDLWPEKFTSVTNGVTQRRWLLHANPLLADFISKRIGRGWITDFAQIKKLGSTASDPESQKEFLAIKKSNKEALLEFLKNENPYRDAQGKIIAHPYEISTQALFDVQIKRFHEYKRQLLNALHLIMLYHELKQNPTSRSITRFSLFAGKSAPGYERSKQIIQLICAIGKTIQKDPIVSKKLIVLFVENYNVSKAEKIIPAADLSEQISLAGWEASGTGNMKLAMNGALTIGTDDGANIEMRTAVTDKWWPFSFGATAAQNKEPYKSWDIYIRDEQIKQAVDSLKDGTFEFTSEDRASFLSIHQSLIEGENSDRYRVLQDLRAYYDTQKKVEVLYQQPYKWAETAIHNIASMGPFSTDESIRRYAEEIWGLKPCPIDSSIFAKVREEYADQDRCSFLAKI